MKDFFGRDIAVGDLVVYPVGSGSGTAAVLEVGIMHRLPGGGKESATVKKITTGFVGWDAARKKHLPYKVKVGTATLSYYQYRFIKVDNLNDLAHFVQKFDPDSWKEFAEAYGLS